MFKKMISIVAVAGLVFALAPAVASAAVMPWDEITGSYRLAFVTSGVATGSSTTIGYYNTFVQTAASASGSTVESLDVDWYCIGSTYGIDAKHNTNTLEIGDTGYDVVNDVPIYDLDGVLFANNNAELWSMTNADPKLRITELGGAITVGTWTGTSLDGSVKTGNALGDDRVERGTTDSVIRTGVTWLGGNTTPSTPYTKSLYALSAPIPEPATMTLLALGGFGVLLKRRRRRV